MATSYSIYDGVTGATVQLNSGDILTTEYENGSEEDGPKTRGYGPVSESLTLLVKTTTAAGVKTAIRSIEAALDNARIRQITKIGPKVYLRAQYDTDSQPWQAELLDGRLSYENFPDLFWRGMAEVKFTFTRMGIWDYTVESELPISSYAGAATTGGRNIINNGVSNWVQVAAAAIDGAAPALLRFSVQNKTGANRTWDKLWIGNNAFGAPTTFTHYIQGESSLSGGGGSSYTYSYGTAPTTAQGWRLSGAQMGAGGRWFRVIMRTTAAISSPIYCRLSICDYFNTGAIWQGGDVSIGNNKTLHDLGAVPIPPGAYGTDYAPVVLRLQAWAESSGSFGIDYFSLVGTDAFRMLKCVGYVVEADEYIEVDEYNERTHLIGVPAGYGITSKLPIFVPYGSPLVAYPGVANRFTIVSECEGTDTSDTYAVRVYYRPARFTI